MAIYDETTIHPLGLAAVLLLGASLLLLPRKYAMLSFIAMACFVSPGQRVAVIGLDFNLIRIMVLFGWVRVLAWREYEGFRWNGIDYALLAFAAVNAAAYTMLYASVAAFVNRLGASFDAVGMYFLFRMLVRSWDDLRQTVVWVIVMAAPVAVALLIEKSTGRNLFAFLGGVPEFTKVREGRLRCQGAFAHPILAGCFFASLLPLMGALWFRGGRWKTLAVVGVGLSLLIVVLCASSTPVLAVLAGAGGMAMYGFRERMRLVRWGVLAVLVMLHMVMIAPVWHLIARISAVGGSTGWHRYHLIDKAIENWDEWVLIGTKSTAHWGWGLEDVTNQYVLEGVRGGIVGLGLFVLVIALAFGRVGRLWRATPPGADRIFAWALGVSLFVHCVNFIAVSYFGQITMLWYLGLAAAGGIAVQRPAVVRRAAAAQQPGPRRVRRAVPAVST